MDSVDTLTNVSEHQSYEFKTTITHYFKQYEKRNEENNN